MTLGTPLDTGDTADKPAKKKKKKKAAAKEETSEESPMEESEPEEEVKTNIPHSPPPDSWLQTHINQFLRWIIKCSGLLGESHCLTY